MMRPFILILVLTCGPATLPSVPVQKDSRPASTRSSSALTWAYEGLYTRSPRGNYVAFVRIPKSGSREPQLWLRRVRDAHTMPLRLRYLGLNTSNVRSLRLAWSGKLIRLSNGQERVYFDTRGRKVVPEH